MIVQQGGDGPRSIIGQPVILVRMVRDPRWQRHGKMPAQRQGIPLIKSAHIAKPFVGEIIAADAYSALAEQTVEPFIALAGEAVGSIVDWGQREDLRQIDKCVPRHGKG